MKFFTVITALLTIPVALTQPVRRDASSIISAITVISDQLSNLGNALGEFNGGTIAALKIHKQATKLATIIKSANQAAKNSDDLNNSDSALVSIAIASLQSDIFSVLDLIVVKKAVFDKAILDVGSARIIVLADLKLLKKKTDKFGVTVRGKLSDMIANFAPLVISNIDVHFGQAIAVYS